MMLTNLLMNRLTGNMTNIDFSKSSSEANKTTVDRFDKYLDNAYQKKPTQDKVQNKSETKQKQNNFSSKRKENHNQNRNGIESNKKNDKNITSGKPKVKNDTKISGESLSSDYNKIKEISKNIVEQISEELDIPIETIEQILSSMNILPINLVDPELCNMFVQELMGVETPFELLTIPDIKDIFETLDAIIDEFVIDLENTEGFEKITSMMQDENFTFEDIMNELNDPFENQFNENNEVIFEEIKNEEFFSTDDNNVVDSKDSDIVHEINIPVENNEDSSFTDQNQDLSNFNSNVEQTETNIGTKLETTKDNDNNIDIEFNTQTIVENEVENITIRNESLKNVNPKDVINQIVQKIKVDVKSDTTEIKLMLRPDNLGEVSLKISTQNGIVTAQFVAENERIKEIIEAGFNDLKDVLQEQGIDISELSVSVGQQDSQKAFEQFNNDSSNNSSHNTRNFVEDDNLNDIELVDTIQTQRYVSDNEVYDTKVDYQA